MLVLKSLQFLQYIKRFSLIGTTLTYAAGDIFVFFVVMAFVIAAFTFLYHFSFGTYMREFSTIARRSSGRTPCSSASRRCGTRRGTTRRTRCRRSS